LTILAGAGRTLALAIMIVFASDVAGPNEPPSNGFSDIRVRLVDYCNGEPVTRIVVALGTTNEDGNSKPGPLPTATTDSRGIAVFHLPKPIARKLYPVWPPNYEFSSCGWDLTLTQLILSTGVVDPRSCGNDEIRSAMVPKPGELVVFGRHVSRWEPMWNEL